MEGQQYQMHQMITDLGDQFQAAIRNIQAASVAIATPPPPVAPSNDTDGRMMERFLKMQPLCFVGITKDTLLPVNWVKEMEKAFEFLGCNEQQKLTCTRYKHQYEAEAWWETIKPILQAAHPVLTWDIFKQAFFGNYFPTSVKKRKEVELAELTQGPKSVEDKQRDAYHVGQSTDKRIAPFFDRGYSKFSKSSGSTTVSSFPQRTQSESTVSGPVYANPNTNTKATDAATPSNALTFKCFTCGQMGHTSRTYQHRRPIHPTHQPTTKPQGWVYSITTSEAEASQNVVTGTVLICSTPAYTLFDTGVTHSFVSPTFAKRTGVSPKSLEVGLAVSIPTGSRIDLDTLYEPCAVTIVGRDMNAHLIQLCMTDFDVILGMDWLAAHKATVLCAKRKIVFQPTGDKGFVFLGDKKKKPRKMRNSLMSSQMI
ncbi:uncharacterized protein LOC122672163 [Telopea speciosissima]|uniref:uncharacterized protein LOC122672163 n=1 Tax=Telopea speciosissima TaxID=54955 RepID=UPI001CC3884A|nr:uncharacterized protein LOC122672163 [Telopea speciosissima]